MSTTDPAFQAVADQPPSGRLRHFVDIVRWRAERYADQVAFTFLAPADGQSETISYSELDERARRIAIALAEQGERGDRVLVVQTPGLDYIASLLGCFYSGRVAVPVYPLDLFRLRSSLPRLEAITRDARARTVLTSVEALGGSANELKVLGSLWGCGAEAVIRTDRLADTAASDYRPERIHSGDVAILQYTSGTTADPRGVVLRHRHLLANAQQIYSAYHVPDAVCVFWLPPYHDMGLVGGLMLPLYAGRPSVLMSPTSFVQDPAAWLRAISDYRGTTTASPNFGFELCLRKVHDETLESLDLSSLRVTISGAEPIRAATMRRFTERFGASGFCPSAFTPAYGMAEATLAITGKPRGCLPRSVRFAAEPLRTNPPTAVAANGTTVDAAGGTTHARTRSVEIVSCGKPLDRTEVIVVDPETRERLGAGMVGEIWVRSPAVAGEYWQRRELSESTFGVRPGSDPAGDSDEGFLRTGDLGFLHDGELFVSGRLKDCLIIAGRNHFAHEIEAAVQAVDPALKVDGGIAFGIEPDSHSEPAMSEADDIAADEASAAGDVAAAGEQLVIVQELLRPKRVDVAELVRQIRMELVERFGLAVAAICFVPAGTLPRTSSGKLRRARCREEYLGGVYSPIFHWVAAHGARESNGAPAANSLVNLEVNSPANPPMNGTSTAGLSHSSGVVSSSASPSNDRSATFESGDRGAIERVVAASWCEVLELSAAEASQHFLDHGGHSLAALSLVSRIRDRLGITVDFETLMRAPRFGQLVDEVVRLVEAGDGELATPDRNGVSVSETAPAKRDDRLTASQQRFWLLDSLGMRQAFLHVELSLRLRGCADPERLLRRVAELPRRHPGLRLRIAVDDSGVPRQRISDELEIDVRRFDWRTVADEDQAIRLRELRRELTDEPLGLEQGPVMRAAWVQLAHDEAELSLIAHHAVCDGWSLRLLAEDLAADLADSPADETDEADEADEGSLGVASTAVATAGTFLEKTPDEQAAGLAYWSERLRGVVDDSRLALGDRVDAADVAEIAETQGADEKPATVCGLMETSASEFLHVDLDRELVERIGQRSRQWAVTPMEILLAAWQRVLIGYSESDEVVIGVPVANRDTPAAERAVGCFINTLPVRCGESIDAAEDAVATFSERVRRTSELWRGDLRHAHVPLDAIIEQLAPRRHAGRLPLVQHLLLHQPPVADGLRIGGAECLDFRSDYATLGAYDTALVCHWKGTRPDSSWAAMASNDGRVHGNGHANGHTNGHTNGAAVIAPRPRRQACRLGLAFNPSRVDLRIAAQMLDRLVRVVRQGVESPDAEFDRLDLAGPQEKQLRSRFNSCDVVHEEGTTVLGQFAEQVEKTPDAVALVDQGGSITYRVLDRAATRLARRLVADGVRVGSVVAFRLGRGRGLVTAALAVWKAGAAYLPIDPNYPTAKIAELLADAAPDRELTDEDLLPALFEAADLGVDDGPPLPGATPDGLAYLIYTSGSTGRPKGVMIGHDNLDNVLRSFARSPGLASGERILACTTMSFDISVLELFLPLVVGAATVMPPTGLAEDADGVRRWLEERTIDVIQATPSSLRMLLACGWSPDAKQRIWCGGEPLERELARRLLAGGGRLWNVYGPTETTVWSLSGEVTLPIASPLSIGRPIDSTTIRIVDSRGVDVPEGVAGELWIGGRGVGRGYWGDSSRTADRFVVAEDGERYYRTGDRVRRTVDGQVLFLGRSDRQIKLRGQRIELGEIEATMSRHPAVRDASVVVVDSAPGDRRLVGFFQAQPQAVVSPAELRDFLAQRLAAAFVPTNLVKLTQWPLTPAGKADLQRLAAAADSPSDMTGYDGCLRHVEGTDGEPNRVAIRTPPQTETELAVAAIWRSVMGDAIAGVELSLEDHFFELGGHSLMAAQVFARLRGELGVALPLREIYAHPTLGELARLVDRERCGDAGLAEPAGLVEFAAASGDDEVILSPAEQRLWFVDRLEPNHPFYNLPLAARVDGPLDLERLWRCLDAVVARHETLRSTYEMVDGQPVRRIADVVSVPRESIDRSEAWGLLSEPDLDAAWHADLVRQASAAFDLAAGPLLRVTHWRLGPSRHGILLVMHHIVSDGWSMSVMMRELAELYRRDAAGEPLGLPPLKVRYRDYAAWQQRRLTAERIAPAIESYRRELDGAVETLDLPTDFPRPAIQDFAGATFAVNMDADTSAAVEQVAIGLGVTPFSVLLTCFGLTLSRWSGQRDLTLGAAAANRDDTALENLIGFFVNTILVRLRTAAIDSFAELVCETHRQATEALSHQEVPFERVVESLAKSRDRSHSPLFQAAFVLQNLPDPLVPTESLKLTPIPVDNGTAKYDLTLTLFRRDDAYQGHFEYRTSLFGSESIGRLADSWRTLLTAAISEPQTPVDALPVVSLGHAERILARSIGARTADVLIATEGQSFSNDADVWPPRCETLTSAFEAAVARYPNETAIRHGDRSIRFEELDRLTDQLAGGLRVAGVTSAGGEIGERGSTGDRVVVFLPRGIDQIACSLAVMRCGAAFVPIDPSVPVGRLAAIVRDLAPRVVIAPAGRLPEIRAAIGTSGPRCLTAGDLVAQDDGVRHPAVVRPDDLAYLIFTSGSTGEPKGIAIEHRSISNFVTEFARSLEIRPGDRCGHLFSPSFDGAIGEIFSALGCGACIEVIDQEDVLDPHRLVETLNRRGIDLVSLTPATLALLEPSRLQKTGKILSAGAPLSGELAGRWLPTHRLFNGYGPTECAIGVAIRELDRSDLASPAVGTPLANTRIYLLDREGRLVPDGVIGEVHIGGRCVARGYWQRQQLDQAAFVDDPFADPDVKAAGDRRMFRSGDLGRWNRHGQLEIVGRRDDQIKLRGFRIEPGEIAGVIERVDGVEAAAVIVEGERSHDADGLGSSDDAGAGRRLIAYVVPESASNRANGEVDDDRQEPDPGSNGRDVSLVDSSVALDRPSADQITEAEQIESWRKSFESFRPAEATNSETVEELANDFSGWSSVITGHAIPPDEMRRWADAAAGRILDLAPRKVLEIGCGTGLMLLRIGTAIERYVGIDLLDSSIERLQRAVATRPDLADKVTLHCRTADRLDDLPAGGFDTIVLNSVVQYFPSEAYLIRVLVAAQRLLAPGGRIFLGDLRNLRLQPALAIAAELARREGRRMTVGEFRGRVRGRIEHDAELLVDPDLLTHLNGQLDRLCEVRSLAKTVPVDNELTHFRFDAVLAFDHPLERVYDRSGRRRTSQRPRLGGQAGTKEATASSSHLRVRHGSVQRERAVQQLLASCVPEQDLDECLAEVDSALRPTVDPASLVRRAQSKGREVRVELAHDSADELLITEVAKGRSVGAGRLRRSGWIPRDAIMVETVGEPAGSGANAEVTYPFSNCPFQRRVSMGLIPRLKRELEHRLPAYMIPSAFVLMDRLPLTVQGKLDRAALPAPPRQREAGAQGLRKPRNETEEMLVAIWEGLLEVAPIGIDDDFFELGGHSMLAVRMVAEWERQTGVSLPLATLFRAPTIERLSDWLSQPRDSASGFVVPLAQGGAGDPLFCIHPAGGTVFCYRELADCFAGGRPVYGVQARGLDGLQPPHETVGEMAEDYAAAIREVVSTGPIHLVGWSLGGNIAYEVARKLRAAGREVGLLALLDSGLLAGEEEPNESEFLPLISALFPGNPAESLEQLRQQSPQDQLAYFIRQAAIAGIVPEELALLGPNVFEVFQANVKAVHEYKPSDYDRPLLLIRPADQERTGELFDDPTLGWGRLVSQVRVESVPGDHAHMLQSPAVSRIAETLQVALTRTASG